MPSDPSKAGRIGGARNTPAQQEARRRNGFQPRKASPGTEERLREIIKGNLPKAEEPAAPVRIPWDELESA